MEVMNGFESTKETKSLRQSSLNTRLLSYKKCPSSLKELDKPKDLEAQTKRKYISFRSADLKQMPLSKFFASQ